MCSGLTPAHAAQLGAAQEEAAAMEVEAPSPPRSRSRSRSRDRKEERAREKWRDRDSTRRVRCLPCCTCCLAKCASSMQSGLCSPMLSARLWCCALPDPMPADNTTDCTNCVSGIVGQGS
jgi:hypothetical protein